MAWLHAAPKRQKNNNDENPKPRIETLADDSPAKCLPDCDEFIAMCFQMSGMVMSGGMGQATLTWAEVEAFSGQSGYTLSGWESEQIILMSRSYCSMSIKAKELSCLPPYQEGISDEEALQAARDRVASQWDSFSSNLKPKKGA